MLSQRSSNFIRLSVRQGLLHLAKLAMIMTCAGLLVSSSHADSLSSEQLGDLMFPTGTHWQDVPVVKWGERPVGLVILRGILSDQEMANIRTSLDTFRRNTGVASITTVSVPFPQDLIERAESADFTIVFGPKGISDSLADFKSLLESALPDGTTAEMAASEAILDQKPAFSKFRFDPTTGVIQKSVTFADTNGDARRVQGIITLALLYSLSPSVLESQTVQILMHKESNGLVIGDLGYKYLNLLYGPKVPVGTLHSDILKLLNE
jgi:hypothetical protein